MADGEVVCSRITTGKRPVSPIHYLDDTGSETRGNRPSCDTWLCGCPAPGEFTSPKDKKRAFSLTRKVSPVSCQTRRVVGLESGAFRAIHRPETPHFGAGWLVRVQAKRGCRLRELNRMEWGVGW